MVHIYGFLNAHKSLALLPFILVTRVPYSSGRYFSIELFNSKSIIVKGHFRAIFHIFDYLEVHFPHGISSHILLFLNL